MNQPRHLKSCLLVGSLLACLIGCSKPALKSETLEGRWTGFEGDQPNAKCTLTITGTNLDYRGVQSNDWCRGTFVLNEWTQPRQLDLTIQEIADPQYAGKSLLGIYEFQGEALKVAVAEPGSAQRPAGLAGGQGVRVFTFKRD